MRPNLILPLLCVASTLGLIGCSSDPRPSEITVAAPAPVFHPGVPAAVKLEDLNWQSCGARLCVTSTDIKKELRNKAKLGRWMSQARSVIQYYRHSTDANVPGASTNAGGNS